MERSQLQPILNTLRQGLRVIYGERLEDVILYGSQARGDARDDSDIDVLVVLKDSFEYGEMLRRTSDLVASLSLENDVVISRAFTSKADYQKSRMPFLMNVRCEGIRI
jgi:predicted nucleotidyltransferase